MKILLLTDKMDMGGAETHLLSLAASLKKSGHSVTLVSSGGGLTQALTASGIRHVTLPFHKKSPFSVLLCHLALTSLIKKRRFDVIHSHARLPSLLVSSVAKRRAIPLVCTAHAKFSVDTFRRALSRWGNSTIAVSEDLKQYLIDEYGLAPENITVIPNGIDTSLFLPSPDVPKNITLSFLSRLDGDCSLGAYLLCEIAPRLVEKFGKLRIVIGGGGSEFERITALAGKVNSSLGFQCITLSGSVADTPRFFAEASAFIGVSRAAIEAASCEIPVIICGNEGFIGELTEDNFDLASSANFCGRGCALPDEDGLFLAICHALTLPKEKLLSRTKRIARLLTENFDSDKTAKKIISVYKSTHVPQKHSRILLCGYYGFGNMGDDALLRSAIVRAKKEFGASSVEALTLHPGRDTKRFGIRCRSRRFPLALLGCRHLIFGGGTLLQEDTSLRSLCYYSFLILIAKMRGAKVYLWGNGIGSPRTKLGRALMRLCLDRCDHIGLRDMNSLATARSLTENRKVFFEDDLAISIAPSSHSRVNHILFQVFGRYGSPPPFILVAPRKSQGLRELTGALREAKKKGLVPIFIAMHPKRDKAITELLCKKMGGILLERICYSDLLGIAGLSQGVYSMRLHPLIAAKSAGVPLRSFSSDEKIRGYFS